MSRTFGRRINAWLAEAPGEIFRDGKWRFWFPLVIGFSIINALLTAMVFSRGENLQENMGAILAGVGAMLAWIALGLLHYSDSNDPRLAKGVAILDSIALSCMAAHFCFLMWVYGHLSTLQSAEADYKIATATYNAEARAVQAGNEKIAEALAKVAESERQRARIENDSIYQARKAGEAGVRIAPRRGSAASSSLSTSPVQLAKPPDPPKDSSADYLTRWDSTIRLANFGELALAIFTLIFIRVRSSLTNSPVENTTDFFPTVRAGSPILQPRLDNRRTSDNERQSLSPSQNSARLSLSEPDRKDALKRLREHLKAIAFHHPNRWFKADLVRGGVTIRFFKREHGHEIAIAETTQSDKLLASVERPDFRTRLLSELIHQGFPLDRVEE